MKIPALPKMNVMRLMLLNQFFWHDSCGDAPDEIHLGVRRAQRQPRFKNEQRAAVQEEQPADQSHRDRHPRGASTEESDDTDGHARGDKDSDYEIEDGQPPLQ